MFSMYQSGQLKITNLIRITGVTGNATNYKDKQGDNPICSTRDEISQPSRPISPRAATAWVGHFGWPPAPSPVFLLNFMFKFV